MRAFMTIAVLIFGFAGVAPACAADADEHPARNVFTHHVPLGHRVGPIVIYDFQPGVVVRAYWASPWRHRHYFPFGGAKAEADEATDSGGPPVPAESFERYWSTSQTFIRELPPRDEKNLPPASQK